MYKHDLRITHHTSIPHSSSSCICSVDRIDYTDMEHYHFNCVLKPPSPSDDFDKGRVYVRLYGPATKTTGKINIKCAVSV